jgi:predicted Zn finger-like uncharacterized protein
MLLVCPACNTRYVVPDAAIGFDGRQVRCANCKHSWFQDGVPTPSAPPAPAIAAPMIPQDEIAGEIAVPSPAPSAPSAFAGSVASPQFAAATALLPEDQTEAAPVAATPVMPNVSAAPVQTGFAAFDNPPKPPPSVATNIPPPPPSAVDELPERSQFAHEPPFKPRRNPAKMWTMAAIAFAVFVALVSLALWQFGVPTGSFSASGKEPDLKIVLNPNHELNYKPDGTPYFIASGTIVNPTAEEVSIPAMLVTLKDAGGRSVYSWKMEAKASKIAPGGKVDFSEAQLDVPRASNSISISWVLNGG